METYMFTGLDEVRYECRRHADDIDVDGIVDYEDIINIFSRILGSWASDLRYG